MSYEDFMENLTKLYESILDYLESYNREKGYSVILGKNQTGNVLHAQDELDITKEVVDGLNAKYEADKQALQQKTTTAP